MSTQQLIDGAGLVEKGIRYSRQHLHRLILAGKFPKPVKIGDNRNAWIEAEVDAYIAARIAQRDAGKAA